MMPTLTPEQAKCFYDRFGTKQDSQAFYEDPAIRKMVANAEFGSAASVFEFGCGTGRLAESLFANNLPATARYLGVDISPAMIAIASERLARYGERVSLLQTDGTKQLTIASDSFDRFVSTYVFDLLSLTDTEQVLHEAHRILNANGLLCLVGLTRGFTAITKCVSALWATFFRIRPQLVGGCRPTNIAEFLPVDRWQIQTRETVAPWGIPSEIVIARKLT